MFKQIWAYDPQPVAFQEPALHNFFFFYSSEMRYRWDNTKVHIIVGNINPAPDRPLLEPKSSPPIALQPSADRYFSFVQVSDKEAAIGDTKI